jgi:hypothetical protein
VPLRSVVAVGFLWLGMSPPAAAQSQPRPGYDPDSPAGVEYQLPHEHVRDRTGKGRGRTGNEAGGGGPGGRSGAGAQLFGAGISRVAFGRGSPDEGDTGSESDRASPGDGPGAADGRRARIAASSPLADSGSSGSILMSAGGVAVVVLLAAWMLGVALRRAKRS